LPCFSTSTADRNWNGKHERLADRAFVSELRAQFVDQFRRLRQDVAHVAEQREVTELALAHELAPRLRLRRSDLFGRFAGAGLGELRLPRLCGSEFTTDQL
jgi:hypothetical protein